jgi:hypothetical protein
MKRTVLDLTQSILSSLNSDEVNSISDTTEALQVAEILRTTYYNILGRAELPEHDKLFQLTPSTDITQPTLMFRPEEGVSKINWIKYYDTSISIDDVSSDFDHDLNVDIEDNADDSSPPSPAYKEVKIIPVKDLIEMTNAFNISESFVGEFTFTDFLDSSELPDTFTHFRYRNDKQPEYCTVIQNYYFIFDSYDINQDDTLQGNKTLVSGFVTPSFTLSDDFVPDLDDWAFPLLLNEAKATAFYELKQAIHPQAEREIDRQWSALQKTKAIVGKPSFFQQLPNFGRFRGCY